MSDGCTCHLCRLVYRVDVLVPDDVWQKIKPDDKPDGAGLICGPCILRLLEARGEFGAFRLVSVP